MAFVTTVILGIAMVIFGFIMGLGPLLDYPNNKEKTAQGQRNIVIGILGALLFFGSASDIDDRDDLYIEAKNHAASLVVTWDSREKAIQELKVQLVDAENSKEISLKKQQMFFEGTIKQLIAERDLEAAKAEAKWAQTASLAKEYEARTLLAEQQLAEFKQVLGE